MFVSEQELRNAMGRQGYEVGAADSQKLLTVSIELRIKAAEHMQGYDTWSQGYLRGYRGQENIYNEPSYTTTVSY
jgi:hypothetical protein